MSFLQPSIPIGTRSWADGFLDTPESDTLPAGAIVDGRNAWFHKVDTNGSRRRATIGKRPGSRLLSRESTRAAKVDGLVAFTREAAAPELLAKIDQFWYRLEPDRFLNGIGTSGWIAGNVGRAELFENQAFLYDSGGSKQALYDGTTVRDVGFAKPTGVTNMTAGAATGGGVTGTYSAKYTWFDQDHGHESSITDDATASLAITAQARVHTKPSGSPPANVTHWRIYVRREDTSEAYWMRVGTVPIADATFAEEIRDAARKDKAPLPSENDPPTATFAVAVAFKGHFIGFPAGSAAMHVSKQGDCEAYNPAHVFKVGAGDGQPVRAARIYGTQCIIQKPGRTYQLVGSTLPFDIEPVHTGWGSVSQDATIEIEGRLYAWDRSKGPYWTDLQNWVSLVDGTVENTITRVSRPYAADIRVAHDERNNLIVWAVPMDGQSRKRVLLAYHYGLGAWLPPITGLEYASLAFFQANDGTQRLVAGDHYGQLWSLFEGRRDAPATGTISGAVTAATADTLTDSTATFYAGGSVGLAGVSVAIRHPATGIWEWRRIASNTTTELTLDTTHGTAWSEIPAEGTPYIIGGIEWWQLTPWLDGGAPLVRKAAHWLDLQWTPNRDDTDIEIALAFDDNSADVEPRSLDMTATTGQARWDEATWDTATWATTTRRARKLRIGRTFESVQMRLAHYEPDHDVVITGFTIGADALVRRTVTGGASS